MVRLRAGGQDLRALARGHLEDARLQRRGGSQSSFLPLLLALLLGCDGAELAQLDPCQLCALHELGLFRAVVALQALIKKKEGEIIIYGKFIDENIDDSFNQYYEQRKDKTDEYQKIYYLRSNYTLKDDLTIPKDKTLIVPKLKTLIVPKGKTLTIDTDGTLKILGDINFNFLV